jgi:hypothetical protein
MCTGFLGNLDILQLRFHVSRPRQGIPTDGFSRGIWYRSSLVVFVLSLAVFCTYVRPLVRGYRLGIAWHRVSPSFPTISVRIVTSKAPLRYLSYFRLWFLALAYTFGIGVLAMLSMPF